MFVFFVFSVAFLGKVVLTLRPRTRLQTWFYHSNALDYIPISTSFHSNITDSGTYITSSGHQKHYITFISSLTASISQWTSFITVMWLENYNNIGYIRYRRNKLIFIKHFMNLLVNGTNWYLSNFLFLIRKGLIEYQFVPSLIKYYSTTFAWLSSMNQNILKNMFVLTFQFIPYCIHIFLKMDLL